MSQVKGRSILLTGASSGLGPHLARRLRAAGAVLILSARSRDALQSLARELGRARTSIRRRNAPEFRVTQVQLAAECPRTDEFDVAAA
jgi:NADP-dependent 3-hydroxy acid dehydrogenase YdfG